MLASAIQLAAGIIFAVTVFMRKTWKDNDVHELTGTILNSTGGVNPKLNQLLYETYMFRIGTLILVVGYLMAIGNIDYNSNSDSLIRILAALGVSGIIVILTHIVCHWLMWRRLQKLSGFRSPSPESEPEKLEDEGRISNGSPQTPASPNRAMLIITLNNGSKKPYSLTVPELGSFILWYNNRASGIGPEVYALNKHLASSRYTSRKDYITFDKIEVFEVNEISRNENSN
ncbi:hypothetical protein FE783_12575 [Paenibacillus mesophilus]|uniref:hypothetical protein n=1 Tax=Paenibacillus mesophilus TaxID=2582849 RepID=UPI00110D39B1|nr:hypothetical protein [Paenibacillus mesophilus]TMV49344.1 hypothetical protein FE783_12575 [Paenibacillus mesophilus]